MPKTLITTVPFADKSRLAPELLEKASNEYNQGPNINRSTLIIDTLDERDAVINYRGDEI
jgi:hypothetical protein